MRLALAVCLTALLACHAVAIDAVRHRPDGPATSLLEEASLRGASSAAANKQQSMRGDSAGADAIAERLARLEQKLEDGQRAVRHQYNVQQLAAEAERKTQELADKQRRREALQKEQTEAAAHVTETLQQAHEALEETRRKDLQVLDGKKKKATEDLKTLLAQISKATTKLEATRREQSRIAGDVKDLTGEREHLIDKIQDYKAQRKAAHSRLRRANAEVDAMEARKSDLADAVSTLKNERDALRGSTKEMNALLKELTNTPLTSSSTKGSSSDQSGCYAALARVRDRMTDVGGTVSELLKVKNRVEDRVDNLHAMIATLTARAESLDRDAPTQAAVGGGDASMDALKADEDSADNEEVDTVSNDELAASTELSSAMDAASAEAEAQAANPLDQTIARSKRALELAAKNGVVGNVGYQQRVEVHASAAPSVSPTPAPSPVPSPSAPPSPSPQPQPPQQQTMTVAVCCERSMACCPSQHVAQTSGTVLVPL